MRTTKATFSSKSILALIMVLLFFTPAFALTPEIYSVEPDHGPNYCTTDITIQGDNFEATPQVALYGGGPYMVGYVHTPSGAYGVYVYGNYAYVADYDSGLQIVDITDPTNPTIVGSADTLFRAYGVYVSGNYAYVADGIFGLLVLKAFEPCTNITFVDSTTLTAEVPAGLPEGTHNLHVTNPNGERAVLHNSFTVQSGLCSDIACSSTSQYFGRVNVGSTSRQSFEITNKGNADLVLGSLSVTGTDASQFSIENDSFSGQICAPSATLAVNILFSPDSEGTKSANLLIPSNDPDTPILEVALNGEGAAESDDGGGDGGGGGVCFIETAAYGFRRVK